MSSLGEAVRQLKTFLESHDIPYMVIGGIALSVWGITRTTRDADFKVFIGDLTITEFRKLVSEKFPIAKRPHLGRAESALVIRVQVAQTFADLLIGVLPYEQQSIERAIVADFEDMTIPICTAEDLIIHKAIADRPQDWLDVESIVGAQQGRLDYAYIQDWLRQFAAALDKPELFERYEALKRKYEQED